MSGAIVRELVTVLGFKTDLKGIKESEQALLSFKTKVALAATAAAAALAKTLDFFGDVAKDTLDTRDIADATGIALSNLLGMGKAAAKYGFEQKQINGLFQTLNGLMRQALFGEGELAKLANETGIVYKDNNNELLKNEEVFQNIIKYLGTIQSKEQQIAIANRIFGEGFGAGVARIARDIENFNANAKKLSEGVSKNIEDNIESIEKYNTSLIDLKNSWNDFVTSLGVLVFPALSFLVDLLTSLTKGLSAIVGYAPTAFKAIGDHLNYDLVHDDDLERLEDFGRKVEAGTWTWADFFGFGTIEPEKLENAGAKNVTNNVTTKVDVQVPPGMNNPQEIGDYVAQMVSQQLDYTINQIYNNNPQVE